MAGRFHRAWDAYRQIAAIKGLLQWVGLWGWIVTALTAGGTWIWVRLERLAAPFQFIAVLFAVLAVISTFLALTRVFNPRSEVAGEGRLFLAGGGIYIKPREVLRPRLIATTIIAATATLIWLNARQRAVVTAVVDPIAQGSALFMECNMTPLPLKVPPDGAYVIPLNKNRIASQDWGFYEIYHDRTRGEMPWPNQDLVKKSAVRDRNPGVWAYECRVSNHGNAGYLYVRVPIDLWFGEGKATRIRYTPIVSALDAGAEFVFYLINDCNIQVAGVWQDKARVQIVGTYEQREIPLRRKFKNPYEQIMMFLPTTTRWVREYPSCD